MTGWMRAQPLLDRLQAPLGERHELARGGRQLGAATPREGERLVDRVGERDPAEALRGEAPQHAARGDGVAEPARDELQRDLDVLDVDLRLDRHALALREL